MTADSSPAADDTADPSVRADEAVDALESAADDLAGARVRVDDAGEDAVERVGDAVDRATDLLKRHERDATGTGDFHAYVELQGELATLVDELPDDLPHRDAFEAALDALDKRRLKRADLDRAREELAPAEAFAERLDDRAAAREQYLAARRRVEDLAADLDDEIDDLERLRRFADVDLDAATGELDDAVTAYDERVREEFAAFRSSAPSREVIEVLAEAADRPLLDAPAPDASLRDYLADDAAGDEPIPTLVEYADASRSKLSHLVDDPVGFAEAVAPARPFLERIDAEPFTVGWPPPPGDRLVWWCREAVPVVGRFTDAETVDRLRDLRDLARTNRYERLRAAAVAADELTAAERTLVADDAVEAAIDEHRHARDRLETALDEHPPS